MKIGKYLLIKINKCIFIQDMNLVQIVKTKSLNDVKKESSKISYFFFLDVNKEYFLHSLSNSNSS